MPTPVLKRTAAGLTLAAAAVGVFALIVALRPHPNALWHVVHDLCVPDMRANGAPAPCMAVNLAGGYAVLRDVRGATQLMLIPTDRVRGIEDPRVLAPASPSYWQAAWEARPLFEHLVGRPAPRDAVGLAINSIYGRSQNQLHIHIDCVRASVRRALAANASRIGDAWSPLTLAHHPYRVRRIEGDDLAASDPFKLLAASDAAARADMGRETLVVIGAVFPGGRPGFVLLNDRADLATLNGGHGEELLDHACKTLSG